MELLKPNVVKELYKNRKIEIDNRFSKFYDTQKDRFFEHVNNCIKERIKLEFNYLVIEECVFEFKININDFIGYNIPQKRIIPYFSNILLTELKNIGYKITTKDVSNEVDGHCKTETKDVAILYE